MAEKRLIVRNGFASNYLLGTFEISNSSNMWAWWLSVKKINIIPSFTEKVQSIMSPS